MQLRAIAGVAKVTISYKSRFGPSVKVPTQEIQLHGWFKSGFPMCPDSEARRKYFCFEAYHFSISCKFYVRCETYHSSICRVFNFGAILTRGGVLFTAEGYWKESQRQHGTVASQRTADAVLCLLESMSSSTKRCEMFP